MNFRKFMKNSKAISPIFATLILIAIAVIAGVVVYMFTSGTLATMTGGGGAAQEKISIQAAQYTTGTSGTVTVYAQCTGGPTPIVNSLIIKNAQGNTVATVTAAITAPASPAPSPVGAMVQGTLYTITGSTTLTAGTYTATLVTSAGGNFISPSFTV